MGIKSTLGIYALFVQLAASSVSKIIELSSLVKVRKYVDARRESSEKVLNIDAPQAPTRWQENEVCKEHFLCVCGCKLFPCLSRRKHFESAGPMIDLRLPVL